MIGISIKTNKHRFYSKALELLPSYVRARYNLSIAYINLGKYEASIDHLLGGLEMQAAEGGPGRVSGVTSEVLWETLEIGCYL